MHKNTLWFIVAILCIYFSLVLCEESSSTAVQDLDSKVSQNSQDLLSSDSTELEEGRTRRRHRHHLYSVWGLYGLAIAYLIKIKVVVVAFFVGSAVYLGMRYLWPSKCGGGIGGGIYKEGPIILDHPPSSYESHHDHIPYALEDHHEHVHDHIPYSLDHDHYHGEGSSFESSGPSGFDPYSAYASNSYSESATPPDAISSDTPPSTFRLKRSAKENEEERQEVEEEQQEVEEEKKEEGSFSTLKNLARQMVISEKQVGDFMFNFLGLDSSACRRRFVCEMEFRSKLNPLTAMAFRIVGRSFFAEYTNDQNPLGKAKNFRECAAVNSECVFIEQNEEAEQEETEQETQEQEPTKNEAEEVEESSNVNKTPEPSEENSLESNDITENENENNLKAELRRNSSYRRRVRGDRHLKLN